MKDNVTIPTTINQTVQQSIQSINRNQSPTKGFTKLGSGLKDGDSRSKHRLEKLKNDYNSTMMDDLFPVKHNWSNPNQLKNNNNFTFFILNWFNK